MQRNPVGKLLLFGATGDLAKRMLLPSLYGLHADGLLPKDLTITGSALRPRSVAEKGAIAASLSPDAVLVKRELQPQEQLRWVARPAPWAWPTGACWYAWGR